MQKIYTLFIIGMAAHTAFAQGTFYIGDNATVVTNSTTTLTLKNTKMVVDGTNAAFAADGTSTLVVTGNASNTASGINVLNGDAAFQNITINKSSNDVRLTGYIEVAGDIAFTSGGIELTSSSVINLSVGATLQNETETNRIYGAGGVVKTYANLNAPTNVNAGNLGAEITSAANLGSTQIIRKHDIVSAIGSGIARTYEVHPNNNAALNARLRFHYFDAEMNGNNETTMVLWRSVNGTTNWIPQTIANRNATANWVEVSGINAFSSWTSANVGALPVKLLSFTGHKDNNLHRLDWITASEQNASHFEIQASPNTSQGGETWQTIGSVRAAGNTNTPQYYSFDNKNIGTGINYYRLKMIDFDGSFDYSNVITIVEKEGRDVVKCYPNPSETGIFTLQGKIFEHTDATISDVLGQNINITIQNNVLDLSEMPTGVYFLRIAGENNTISVVKL